VEFSCLLVQRCLGGLRGRELVFRHSDQAAEFPLFLAWISSSGGGEVLDNILTPAKAWQPQHLSDSHHSGRGPACANGLCGLPLVTLEAMLQEHGIPARDSLGLPGMHWHWPDAVLKHLAVQLQNGLRPIECIVHLP